MLTHRSESIYCRPASLFCLMSGRHGVFLLFRHGATECFPTATAAAAATVVDVAEATTLIPDISKLIAEYAVTQYRLLPQHRYNRCDGICSNLKTRSRISVAAPAALAETNKLISSESALALLAGPPSPSQLLHTLVEFSLFLYRLERSVGAGARQQPNHPQQHSANFY
jgi:hypothetical protein